MNIASVCFFGLYVNKRFHVCRFKFKLQK